MPVDPMTLASVGMGLGKAISGLIGRGKQKRKRAAAMRWSPWSRLGVPEEKGGDLAGDILKGVGMGARGYQELDKVFGARGASRSPQMTLAEGQKDPAMAGITDIQSADPTAQALGQQAARPASYWEEIMRRKHSGAY